MDPLKISTCMSPNMDFICQELAHYISINLSIPVQLEIDLPWQERERLLDMGKIDLCWICGLPYVLKADRAPGRIEPLVAPVMENPRYQNRPVYYSEVVVHRDSSFLGWTDLRGATWAYNEPGSHSGYNLVRYTLAMQGESFGFFGRVVESGAHLNSLQMILKKEVDGSAIDSTVLELELMDNPEIQSQIRIIDTLGPSPIPPWVISLNTPFEIHRALRELFIQMDSNPQGQNILKCARMARFAPMDDHDYDPIREMTYRTLNQG